MADYFEARLGKDGYFFLYQTVGDDDHVSRHMAGDINKDGKVDIIVDNATAIVATERFRRLASGYGYVRGKPATEDERQNAQKLMASGWPRAMQRHNDFSRALHEGKLEMHDVNVPEPYFTFSSEGRERRAYLGIPAGSDRIAIDLRTVVVGSRQMGVLGIKPDELITAFHRNTCSTTEVDEIEDPILLQSAEYRELAEKLEAARKTDAGRRDESTRRYFEDFRQALEKGELRSPANPAECEKRCFYFYDKDGWEQLAHVTLKGDRVEELTIKWSDPCLFAMSRVNDASHPGWLDPIRPQLKALLDKQGK